MIHFQITDSPDRNVVNEFHYFQNQVYVGRTTGDLWIEDNHLLPMQVMLEVIGNELLVHPQKGVEFYQINGKRASTIRKIKVNDTITIGKTTIKILSFQETVRQTKREILNDKLAKLIEANAPRMTVVERLTKAMKE